MKIWPQIIGVNENWVKIHRPSMTVKTILSDGIDHDEYDGGICKSISPLLFKILAKQDHKIAISGKRFSVTW